MLDDAVRIPGTDRGIGLDAVIGLLPGIGDVAGSALSAVVVSDAIRQRVPVPVLARMGWNLLVDAGLGLVPLAGDVADVLHRANRKNVILLRETLEARPPLAPGEDPPRPTPGYLLAALGLVVLPLVLGIVLGVLAVVVLVRWLF
ncbi:MAG: hypothetical protein CMH83_09785 [Nocardioides sp.]|nr:hypothetical protein [Nocardioides sp.]